MRARWLTAAFLPVVLTLVWVVACAAAQRPVERVSPPPAVNAQAVVWRTPKPSANPQPGDVWVNPKDGAEMVYVPQGEFILGSSDAQLDAWLKERPADRREGYKTEQPQCRVNLPGYWIGRTEVTNAQYLRFVQATGHRAPKHWKEGKMPSGLESFPVVHVSWEDACAYCEWAGGHLPSELQWEKAARGTDGRTFPWGNQWDRKRCRNFEFITGRNYKSYKTIDEWNAAYKHWAGSHDRLRDGPAAVGAHGAGASPYGCLDMAGNVWEWCADWYESAPYRRYAKGDLKPPARGLVDLRVLRGGSWVDWPKLFRCTFRGANVPDDRDNYCLGFRCVRGAG